MPKNYCYYLILLHRCRSRILRSKEEQITYRRECICFLPFFSLLNPITSEPLSNLHLNYVRTTYIAHSVDILHQLLVIFLYANRRLLRHLLYLIHLFHRPQQRLLSHLINLLQNIIAQMIFLDLHSRLTIINLLFVVPQFILVKIDLNIEWKTFARISGSWHIPY